MRSWRRPDPECGTAGCIGAFSDILWGEAVNHSEERLANLLGIGFVAVNNLVYMWNSSFDLPDVTRDDAVAVLRHLANTGKVQWDQVLRNRGKEPVQ